MATASFGTLVDPEQQEIERRRAMAQMLQQQASTPFQNQTAGGMTVPISPLEGLSKLAQALMAKRGNEKADEQQRAYVEKKTAQSQQEMQGIADALRGTPAVAEQNFGSSPQRNLMMGEKNLDMTGQAAPDATIAAQAATPPDMNKAMALALRSENPMAQGIGSNLLAALMPKSAKWERVEKPLEDGRKEVGFVNVNSADPWSTFTKGGTAPVKLEGVNTGGGTTFVNPYSPNAQGAPTVAATGNKFKDVVVEGPGGALVPNAPLVAAKKDIAKSGASNISVSTEKGYSGELAKGLAKQDLDALDAARSAPQRVQAAQQVRKILDTQAPITGTGAEGRLAVNKALATAGIIDGQAVKSTEDLASLLANQTLEAIKTSGLGSGQGFTDKDRQFLERAKSGNIEINAGTLRTLADLNEKSARSALEQGERVAKRIRGNKDFGTVGQDISFEQPAPYSPKQTTPAKPPAQGRTLTYNPATGTFQ